MPQRNSRRSLSRRAAVIISLTATLAASSATFAATDQEAHQAQARGGMIGSTWPTGRSDSWRSGAALGAGLPAGFEPGSLVARPVALGPVPTWPVVGPDGMAYVLGGQPFLLDTFSNVSLADAGSSMASDRMGVGAAVSAAVQPYVVKIDTATMHVIDMLELPRGTSLNYTSSLVFHENGYLYTIATATLFEIDPQTMTIRRSLDLPLYENAPAQTAYNSVQVAPGSGDIVTKGVSAGDSSLPAKLVSVDTTDPGDLTVRYQLDAPIAATRLGVVSSDVGEYVYASDESQSQRFLISDSGFVTDVDWAQTYRTSGDGTTGAVSMVYMPNQELVVFPNNNTVIFNVSAPLSIFTQSTTTDAAVASSLATSVTTAGGSFYSVAADPYVSQMVITNDQINRVMAGRRLEDDGTLSRVWETELYRSSAGTAIASDRGHLYLDDLRCTAEDSDCETYLVVLDLETGAQLDEIKVAGLAPSLGQIFLDEDSVYYVASEAGKDGGFVTRVSVD